MKTRIIGAILAVILAIAGAVVLVLYVQGADQRAQASAELAEVFVITDPVPRGTPGEAINDLVEVKSIPALAIQPDIVTNLDDLAGLVATADLLPGDQLVNGRFADPQDLAGSGDAVLPEGTQEVTIALPVERVAGGVVSAGSTVGVVVTANVPAVGADGASDDDRSVTQFVFQIDAGDCILCPSERPTPWVVRKIRPEPAVDAIMVTVAATVPQVEMLAYGAEQQQDGSGGIWLTLEPENADQSGTTRRNGENIFQ